MPKANSTPSLLKRIDALKEIFIRAKSLSFDELLPRLESVLNENIGEMRRTIYRDLERLVDSGFLQVEYRYMDGSTAQLNDSGNVPKGAHALWVFTDHKLNSLSESILKTNDVQIECGPGLKSHIQVNRQKPKQKNILLISWISSHSHYFISFDLSAAPFNLLIGRRNTLNSNRGFFDKLTTTFTQRLAMIEFPIPTMSAIKESGTSQMLVNVSKNKVVILKSNGGKNHCQVSDVTIKQLNDIETNLYNFGHMTQTSDDLNINENNLINLKELEVVSGNAYIIVSNKDFLIIKRE